MAQARIAVYGGGGAPYHHGAVFARAGHVVDFVFPADIEAGCLASFDAFVMPGGGYRAMGGQVAPLGHSGARAIHAFVETGGMYIGSCAGSYIAAIASAGFVAAYPAQAELRVLESRIWNEADLSPDGLQSPGVGVVLVRNTASEHPIMRGMEPTFPMVHYNGPLFRGSEPLAVIAGATDRFTPAEAFLGGRAEVTLLDDAINAGAANIVAGKSGMGRVVLFGSHPEFGSLLPMDDPPSSARMLENAVQWQLGEMGQRQTDGLRLATHSGCVADDSLLTNVGRLVEQIRERRELLLGRPTRDRRWLDPRYAISVFGLSPAEIWSRALDEIERLCRSVELGAAGLPHWALSYRQPWQWDIDGGFHGVVALLEQAASMLSAAIAGWDIDLGPPSDDPYEFALKSPFHLVGGSYLSAIGRLASAALLCETYGSATEQS